MAVQQNRSTRKTRGDRRSHDRLKPRELSIEPTTGEVHIRHCISPDGYYRGKKVLGNEDIYEAG
jgi:large subunit ribosomal protein L32